MILSKRQQMSGPLVILEARIGVSKRLACTDAWEAMRVLQMRQLVAIIRRDLAKMDCPVEVS